MFLSEKWFYNWFRYFILLVGLSGCRGEELNIFAFGTYLPIEIIRIFEQETGIRVRVIEANNNQTLLAKLSVQQGDYDLAVPSSYVIEKLVKKGLVLPLNWQELSDFILVPELTQEKYNPTIKYNLPFGWGITGIIAKNGFQGNVQDFWQKKYRVLLLDDVREVLSFSLLSLGYEVNTLDLSQISAAFGKLRRLKGHLKFLTNDNLLSRYLDNEVDLGLAWSGDYALLTRESKLFNFIIPPAGYVLWYDSWVILRGAKHLKAAYAFLRFINRPEIAAHLAEIIGFSTANLKGEALIKTEPYLYYHPYWFKKGQIQHDLGEEIEGLIYNYWEKFLSEESLV